MAFWTVGAGHFEVIYETQEDMAPQRQAALLRSIESELAKHAVSVLFLVADAPVPRSVPEFWMRVTSKYAPRLCALAVVSASRTVRVGAGICSMTNTLRGVRVRVQAFAPPDEARATRWCHEVRSSAGVALAA